MRHNARGGGFQVRPDKGDAQSFLLRYLWCFFPPGGFFMLFYMDMGF